MLSRIFCEPLMSISNKHNYKAFSKSPPASLVHCIENVLSHTSGKCHANSSANFQPILDRSIPNFKLKYEDSENMKADPVNSHFNSH